MGSHKQQTHCFACERFQETPHLPAVCDIALARGTSGNNAAASKRNSLGHLFQAICSGDGPEYEVAIVCRPSTGRRDMESRRHCAREESSTFGGRADTNGRRRHYSWPERQWRPLVLNWPLIDAFIRLSRSAWHSNGARNWGRRKQRSAPVDGRKADCRLIKAAPR